MNAANRLIVSALVRLVLLFYAGWFAFADQALGPEASMVTRIGLAILFLVLSVLVGEITQMRTHFGLLIGAMRAAGGVMGAAAAPIAVAQNAVESSADPRPEAVDILIRALGSESAEAREAAHGQLVRLTGQELPLEQDAWTEWWKLNRKGFAP